jgi:hypothetical protein
MTRFSHETNSPVSFEVRLLQLADAQAVQDVYDSQPKLMLVEKRKDAPPYADTFKSLLSSGCYAYGAFNSGILCAFSVFFVWQGLPATTLVLSCCRPTGGVYRPEKSGFAAALDAAIFHAEQDSRYMIFAVRSANKKWDHHTVVSPRVGRFYEYRSTVAERIAAGSLSKFHAINQMVLGSRPVSADAVLICAIAPWGNDAPLDAKP